jgi:lipopolysaccharide export system protein LptC
MLGDAAAGRGMRRHGPMETMSAPATKADWAAPRRKFAFGASSQSDGEARRQRAFVAAARHSRLVRILRFATPTAALLAIAAMILFAVFNPFRRQVGDLSVGELSVDGTKIVMNHPRLTGVRRDGRSYVVNADKAIQDVLHPTTVELKGIDGDVAMADDGRLKMTAASGVYDSTLQSLKLTKDVHLHSPNYDVTLMSADIDFKAGNYRSDQPVTIVTDSGATIHADSAEARDNGGELTFTGHVHSTFAGDAGAPSLSDLKGTNK